MTEKLFTGTLNHSKKKKKTAASNLIGNPEDRFALDTSCMIIRYRCDAPLQIFTFVEDYLNSLCLELEKKCFTGVQLK